MIAILADISIPLPTLMQAQEVVNNNPMTTFVGVIMATVGILKTCGIGLDQYKAAITWLIGLIKSKASVTPGTSTDVTLDRLEDLLDSIVAELIDKEKVSVEETQKLIAPFIPVVQAARAARFRESINHRYHIEPPTERITDPTCIVIPDTTPPAEKAT